MALRAFPDPACERRERARLVSQTSRATPVSIVATATFARHMRRSVLAAESALRPRTVTATTNALPNLRLELPVITTTLVLPHAAMSFARLPRLDSLTDPQPSAPGR